MRWVNALMEIDASIFIKKVKKGFFLKLKIYLIKLDVDTFQQNFSVFIDQIFGRINESISATDSYELILNKAPFR